MDFIPTFISGLVPANEKNRGSIRIEGIKHPEGPASDLNPEFPHSRVLRLRNAGRIRMVQGRTVFLEQSNGGIDSCLLSGCEALPPDAEVVGEFDLPSHDPLCPRQNIPSRA